MRVRLLAPALLLAGTTYVGAGTVLDLASPGSADFTVWGDRLDSLSRSLLADVNADGYADFIVTRGASGDVCVFLGPISFPTQHDLASEIPPLCIAGEPNLKFTSGLAAGDLDSDGLPELIVGSPNGPPPSFSSGTVAVFRGRRSWPSRLAVADADWVFYGVPDPDLAASVTAAVGDLNADGAADLVLSFPFSDGPGGARPDAGDTYVMFGPASKWTKRVVDFAVDSADVHILGADGRMLATSAGDRLGYSGPLLVDLNGDSIVDLLLQAPGGDGPDELRNDAGEVYVFYGRRSWPASIDTRDRPSANAIVYGPEPAFAMQSMAVADWDGDGATDLVLASGSVTPVLGRTSAGAVFILRGGSGLVGQRDMQFTPPEGTIFGPVTNARMGAFMQFGDIDGDGYADLAVSATNWDSILRVNSGAVHVITGCGNPWGTRDLAVEPAELSILGADSLDFYGKYVLAGDLDGDGRADVVAASSASASLGNSRGSSAGEIHAVRGRSLRAMFCAVSADAGPSMSLCEGRSAVLDGSGSVVTSCSLTPQYRWLLGATVVRDWATDPTAAVLPSGTSLFRLEVRCGDCRGPCFGSATVMVTVVPDPVPFNQGNVLRAARAGDNVELEFAAAPATRWRLYRDSDKLSLGSTALTPDSVTTNFSDPGVVPLPPTLWFYRVKGLSPCSFTPGP